MKVFLVGDAASCAKKDQKVPQGAAEIGGAAPSEEFCGDGFCMLEAGDDLAGVAFGDFFHQPSPDVHVKSIGRAWHLGKVLFEK